MFAGIFYGSTLLLFREEQLFQLLFYCDWLKVEIECDCSVVSVLAWIDPSISPTHTHNLAHNLTQSTNGIHRHQFVCTVIADGRGVGVKK